MPIVNLHPKLLSPLCVRPLSSFLFLPLAHLIIVVFAMWLALDFALSSCGNYGEDDDAAGMVTVTIDNLSVTVGLLVNAEKPLQWNGMELKIEN